MRAHRSAYSKNSLQVWQKYIVYVLYAAMAVKAFAVFFPVLDFAGSTLVAVFFLAELFLLPPVGMILMTFLVSILFYLLPSIVMLLFTLVVDSIFLLFLGTVICYLLSGIIFTFVGGFLVSIQVISVTAPAVYAAGFALASTGIGAAVGYGTKAAIDSVSESAGYRRRRPFLFLYNLLILFIIGWPLLSYANGVSNGLSCKPAVILSQAHRNYLNIGASKVYRELFEKEEKRVFRSNFYSSVIMNGNNNIIQGKKALIANDEENFAFLLNGILYIEKKDLTQMYKAACYLPRKTDALILLDSTAFIFGRNKVFVCGNEGSQKKIRMVM